MTHKDLIHWANNAAEHKFQPLLCHILQNNSSH